MLIFKELKNRCFRIGKTDLDALLNFKNPPVSESSKLHLVRAFGLAAVYRICGTKNAFANGFEEANKWRSNRGRPTALRIALRWLGVDEIIIIPNGDLNRWNCFQIGIKQKKDDSEVEKIKSLVRLSSPARSIFERLFLLSNNTQKICLSESSSLLSQNILSTDSGHVDKGGFVNGLL